MRLQPRRAQRAFQSRLSRKLRCTMDGVKDSRSEHKSQNLNARLLRFRAQPESEDAYSLAEALLAAQRYADVRLVTGGAQSSGSEDGALLVLEGRDWLQERDLVRAQAVLLR